MTTPLPTSQPPLFPILAKLNPWPLGEKLPYLLGSVIVARVLVGLTRIVADNPLWNPAPVSRRDKVDTLWERVFMEGLGTVGTFVALHLGQDVTANVIERLNPALKPTALLNRTASVLDTPQQTQLKAALAKTFKTLPQQLEKAPVLARVLYDKANVFNLKEHLADPALWNVIAPMTEGHFAGLNQWAKAPLLGGLTASTLFGGAAWQWLNDHVVRKQVIPRLTEPIVRRWGDDQRPASPPQQRPMATLPASAPLAVISHTSNLEGSGMTAPPAVAPLPDLSVSLPSPWATRAAYRLSPLPVWTTGGRTL